MCQVPETFKRLKSICEVRSKLVHGDSVDKEKVATANADAPLLAKAVLRKAVEQGWPSQQTLDALAMTVENHLVDDPLG